MISCGADQTPAYIPEAVIFESELNAALLAVPVAQGITRFGNIGLSGTLAYEVDRVTGRAIFAQLDAGFGIIQQYFGIPDMAERDLLCNVLWIERGIHKFTQVITTLSTVPVFDWTLAGIETVFECGDSIGIVNGTYLYFAEGIEQ